jgi:hypothetical protein
LKVASHIELNSNELAEWMRTLEMSELAVIPEDIKAEIHRRLRRVEEEESVRIILAIESGRDQRAW